MPDNWGVDLDADFDKNEETTIRYAKLPTKYDIFDFNQRELFMWAVSLPFIGDPQASSSDAKMRAFVEYFLNEKYWKISYSENRDVNTDLSVIPHKITIDKTLKKKLKYNFYCLEGEYAKIIELIFGKSQDDARKIATDNTSDYDLFEVKTPSYYHLKTFFPEFLDKISTLQGFNRDLFERMKTNKATLSDILNRSYGIESNFSHFYNQYELFKYIKDKENDKK